MQQQYDTSMKALFKEEFVEIVPHLLLGASLLDVLDIEILRPAMRADRAYRIMYREQAHIFHLEFQAGEDDEIAYRSLMYHAGLLRDHQLAVISMIVYLFKTHVVESPLKEMSGKEELLSFNFKVLKLWTLDAREYVHKHIISMYTLLPTMQYADASLLLHAIDEMVEYFKDNEAKLARRLLWLTTFLKRTDTVSAPDKKRVEERMSTFEHLLEQNDFVRRQRILGEELGFAKGKSLGLAKGEELGLARGEELGLARGEELGLAKGETKEAQQSLFLLIDARFPGLSEFARSSITRITLLEHIHIAMQQIAVAPDEEVARTILTALLEKSL